MRLVVKMAVLILVLIAFVSGVMAQASSPPTSVSSEGKVKEKKQLEVIFFAVPDKIDTAMTYWQVPKGALLKDIPSAKGKPICKIAEGSVLREIGRGGKDDTWIKLEGIPNNTTSDTISYEGYTYKNYLKPYPPPEEKKKKDKSE